MSIKVPPQTLDNELVLPKKTGSSVRVWLTAIGISLALNSGIVFQKEVNKKAQQIAEELHTQSRTFRNRLTAIFRQFNSDKSLLPSQNKEKMQDYINSPGRFFNLSEYEQGGLNNTELNKSEKVLSEDIKELKAIKKGPNNELEVGESMCKKQRQYSPNYSYMSHILLKGKGNCEARTKLMITYFKKVLPNAQIKIQLLNDHIQLIAKLNNAWYALNKPKFDPANPNKPCLTPILSSDLDRTAIMDADAFQKSYFKKKVEARLFKKGKVTTSSETGSTDTYFSLGKNIKAKLRASNTSGQSSTEEKDPDLVQREYDEKQHQTKRLRFHRTLAKSPRHQNSQLMVQLLHKKVEKKVEKKKLNKIFTITPAIITNAKITGTINLIGKNVKNLSALKGLDLKKVYLQGSNVKSLSVFAGMRLKELDISNTDITDLTPLKTTNENYEGVVITLNNKAHDLRPIKNIIDARDDIKLAQSTVTHPLDHKIDGQNYRLVKIKGVVSAKKGSNKECIYFLSLNRSQIIYCLGDGATVIFDCKISEIHFLKKEEEVIIHRKNNNPEESCQHENEKHRTHDKVIKESVRWVKKPPEIEFVAESTKKTPCVKFQTENGESKKICIGDQAKENKNCIVFDIRQTKKADQHSIEMYYQNEVIDKNPSVSNDCSDEYEGYKIKKKSVKWLKN